MILSVIPNPTGYQAQTETGEVLGALIDDQAGWIGMFPPSNGYGEPELVHYGRNAHPFFVAVFAMLNIERGEAMEAFEVWIRGNNEDRLDWQTSAKEVA